MKKTTLITLTSIVGLTALILGGANAQAEGTTSKPGDSEATVTLKKK